MKITDILAEEALVADLGGKTKDEVIVELARVVATHHPEINHARLVGALEERERLVQIAGAALRPREKRVGECHAALIGDFRAQHRATRECGGGFGQVALKQRGGAEVREREGGDTGGADPFGER